MGSLKPETKMTFWLLWQWVVQGAVNVDIGANPSAEGGEEDEGVDDQAVKVVDVVDTFRLQVRTHAKLTTLYFGDFTFIISVTVFIGG